MAARERRRASIFGPPDSQYLKVLKSDERPRERSQRLCSVPTQGRLSGSLA